MNNKIKVAIIGVTGYAGQEILRFLLNHPYVEIHTIISHSYAGKKISEIYGNFKGICDIVCSEEMNLEALSKQVDVIFLSLPHGIASGMVTNEVLLNCKVIDLGPDFRIKDVNEYEK
ncbi:hypothetical protein FACS189459_5970 [Bacilli bacterium]|nr:hypothetical protein FACS189459_5970 [Bacilli bacterium]